MPPRVVVVGSLMMDLVVRAPRLPLAGESLISHSLLRFPGGKGANQAVAAARLGADVALIGRVGADDFGRELLRGLTTDGIDIQHVSVDAELGTGVAVPIVSDDGENAILAIPQANLSLGRAEVEAARGEIERADMLLLQFEVGMEAVLSAARIARAAGVRVLLNPAPIAPHPREVLGLASVLVVNEVEAAALVPSAAGDHSAELAGLHSLAGLAVVTLGGEGCLANFGHGVIQLPAFRVEAVDSVGAGDAFCAGLGVALAEGRDGEAAIRFASAAGALAATRAGAQASLPYRTEVEALAGAG